MGKFRKRQRSENRIWYVGALRHFRPRRGFCVELMIVTQARTWLEELPPERVASVGPYEACVELLEERLRDLPWFLRPDEMRVNDSELASRLSRVARWYEFQTLTNDQHGPLEDARHEVQREGLCSVARWLSFDPPSPKHHRSDAA